MLFRSGWIAQRIEAAFAAHGLDPFAYGCVGFDPAMKTVTRKAVDGDGQSIEETVEIPDTDENGVPRTIHNLRLAEVTAFALAGLAARLDALVADLPVAPDDRDAVTGLAMRLGTRDRLASGAFCARVQGADRAEPDSLARRTPHGSCPAIPVRHEQERQRNRGGGRVRRSVLFLAGVSEVLRPRAAALPAAQFSVTASSPGTGRRAIEPLKSSEIRVVHRVRW